MNVSLASAVQTSLDTAEFGYHELSEAEARQIVVTVHHWMVENMWASICWNLAGNDRDTPSANPANLAPGGRYLDSRDACPREAKMAVPRQRAEVEAEIADHVANARLLAALGSPQAGDAEMRLADLGLDELHELLAHR